MSADSPTTNGPGQYPERDNVPDIDPSSRDDRESGQPQEPSHREDRDRQERGNRGPDEQPGFGQGA